MDWREHLHAMVASRRCLQCQARISSRHTVRRPILSLLLQSGPGVAENVDYVDPLPVTPPGNCHSFLVTDRSSRRADIYAVLDAELTAEGKEYKPLCGCPASHLSENGLHFCSKLSHVEYQRPGMRKITTSTYHLNANDGVERVNHITSQMLAMAYNELQNDGDIHSPHVEFPYHNFVRAVNGLALNVMVYMNRLPPLSLTFCGQHYA